MGDSLFLLGFKKVPGGSHGVVCQHLEGQRGSKEQGVQPPATSAVQVVVLNPLFPNLQIFILSKKEKRVKCHCWCTNSFTNIYPEHGHFTFHCVSSVWCS